MIKEKYPKFQLDHDYYEKALSTDSINLVILGRDPYPNGAVSIPFLKQSWSGIKKGSAGYNLFLSLFGCIPSEKYLTPQECAFALLEAGIVLLNASYNYLNNETISRTRHLLYISEAREVNLPILERAKTILACGDAYSMLGMVATLDGTVKKIPHPSTQSRNSPSTDKKLWDVYWCRHMLNKAFKSDS
ncbi:hypothetical protein [Vibrio parahaemolyticus]|uniref:hypothetical protein n=1 Tax=Vibrio parahaemolyticus TaxID=670 RepID=UPI001A1BA2D6|nr:hypothetical protein [Vibrio parahaemolyticus]HCD1298759.1 hypothetical protein [Vibrio parahaemolyticus]